MALVFSLKAVVFVCKRVQFDPLNSLFYAPDLCL